MQRRTAFDIHRSEHDSFVCEQCRDSTQLLRQYGHVQHGGTERGVHGGATLEQRAEHISETESRGPPDWAATLVIWRVGIGLVG